jgi:CheY-like chemotaxis protein
MPQKIVLVVEDEALVRMCAVDILQDAGYHVLEATSAEEAFCILAQRNDIALIFTDVQMGGMDGIRFARAVREKWPPVRIIVTSGRIDPRSELPLGVSFIAKPYDSSTLQAGVQSSLVGWQSFM